MSAEAAAGPGVIDLNADLGESFGAWRLGDDQALLAVVGSANIAAMGARLRFALSRG